MSTTKNDIVVSISKATGIMQRDVREVVQMTLDGIVETLASEGRLEWRGFGVFEVRAYEARQGRNPRTGEQVFVPAGKMVNFKAGRVMRERIKDGKGQGDVGGAPWQSHRSVWMPSARNAHDHVRDERGLS